MDLVQKHVATTDNDELMAAVDHVTHGTYSLSISYKLAPLSTFGGRILLNMKLKPAHPHNIPSCTKMVELSIDGKFPLCSDQFVNLSK